MTTQPAARTTVDPLVVGSGTGMAAALAARELGLSALIIEKTAYVGGSTARSGRRFWMPANPVPPSGRLAGLATRSSPLSGGRGRRRRAGRAVGELPGARLGHRGHALPHHPMKFMWAKGVLRLPPRGARRQRGRPHLQCRPGSTPRCSAPDARDLRPGVMKSSFPMPVTGAESLAQPGRAHAPQSTAARAEAGLPGSRRVGGRAALRRRWPGPGGGHVRRGAACGHSGVDQHR